MSLALKLGVVAQLHRHPLLQPTGSLDAGYYADLGRRVAGGDLLLWGLGPEPFVVAPLYAWFLGAALALTGGSLLGARVLQASLGVLAVWLVHRSARRWGGPVAAAAAASLFALTGFVTFSEALISQAALDAILTALALWAWGEALAQDTPRAHVWAGAALGLLALDRPNALAVAVTMPVLLVLTRRSRDGAARTGLLLAGLALALAPCFLRNLAVSGQPVLVSAHGGLNFYIGNHAAADGRYRSVPGVRANIAGQAEDARRQAEAQAGRALSAAQASDWFYARAFEWIGAHPGAALALLARKLGYLLHGADLALNHSYDYYAHDERTLLRGAWVGPWLLVPAGLLGMALRAARRPHGPFLLWAAFVPLMSLAVAAFFVTSRYRLPLLPPLAVGSGLLLEMGLSAWRRGRWRALVAGSVVFAALLAAANRPLGIDSGRGAERAAMVQVLVEQGRIGDARRLLERAQAQDPHPERLLLRAGRAFGARGDFAAAAELLERAHTLAPHDLEIRLALGEAHFSAGDARRAVAHLGAAFEGGIEPTVAGPDLARAQAASGDPGAARRTLAALGGMEGLDVARLRALAALALELGDPALAAAFLARLLEIGPDDPDVLQKLGVALSLAGRPVEAVASLERAADLAPQRADVHLALAAALAEAGQRHRALLSVRLVLELRPDHPEARRLLDVLERSRR